ncbi:MAG: EscU/YscU/HrcU family type III secretion system export apparatus switch protein [Alphaproteobacteria bacterium]|nr:EscU/YscU/HrcU family type III secretion system export apparatus switch protein [Alphaproteobacteria bacterium]
MNNSIFHNDDNDDTDFSTSNKKDYAVALGYDQDKNNAPVVLAKGGGDIAQKIVKIAEENGIEIRKDADLLQILKVVDINEEIPVEAFAAVAGIISYIYQKNAQS